MNMVDAELGASAGARRGDCGGRRIECDWKTRWNVGGGNGEFESGDGAL